jgi:hypothetical protein
MRKFGLLLGGCALLPLALSGCDTVKQTLGLSVTVPNEFDVVANAPLAVPPDFELRPPKPGTDPSQEVSATAQAKQAIFRAGDQQQATLPAPSGSRSAGEDQILRAAGVTSAPSDIRDTVDKEAKEGAPFNKTFVDKLVFWRDSKKQKEQRKELLDPDREADRLREQKGSSTTVATEFSAPPTIERKGGESVFDSLF